MLEITPPFLRNALKCLPQKLKDAEIDALVIDTGHVQVQIVAMAMDLPFVEVWSALHMDASGATPPSVYGWPHEDTPEARERNLNGLKPLWALIGPAMSVADDYAKSMGLMINWLDPNATTPPLAVLTQTPREFDYPNIPWPEQFVYAGPFQDEEGRALVWFPWERLTGETLVYASLGTVVNGIEDIYRIIIEAMSNIPSVQLMLSVGKKVSVEALGELPPHTIVVQSAPQLALLRKAALCITHAGLNTTLEAITHGVPMVAIPIAFDQPGVAARIKFHGIGEILELANLTAGKLEQAVRTILETPAYRERTREMQSAVLKTDGLDVAADAIVRAFKS